MPLLFEQPRSRLRVTGGARRQSIGALSVLRTTQASGPARRVSSREAAVCIRFNSPHLPFVSRTPSWTKRGGFQGEVTGSGALGEFARSQWIAEAGGDCHGELAFEFAVQSYAILPARE